MVETVLLVSVHWTNITGMFLIAIIAIGVACLIWNDYKKVQNEQCHVQFHIGDFLKKERLYIFLFWMFFFLIGGELLLYSSL